MTTKDWVLCATKRRPNHPECQAVACHYSRASQQLSAYHDACFGHTQFVAGVLLRCNIYHERIFTRDFGRTLHAPGKKVVRER